MHATKKLIRFASGLSLLALAAAPLHAQRFGILAGGTFSNLRSSEDLDFERRTGTIFGGTLQIPVGNVIAIQPEFLFLNKGTKFRERGMNSNGRTTNVRLDYLELPVLLRVDFSRELIGPHIYAGPSVGFNVGCKIGVESGTPLPTSKCSEDSVQPKKLDYGFTVGGGVDFNLGGLALTGGARYGIGLADIVDDDSDEFKSRVNNGVLSLYVGLLFGSLKR
ncbi:MAG: porin family protein [Gemmatimonas sp.]